MLSYALDMETVDSARLIAKTFISGCIPRDSKQLLLDPPLYPQPCRAEWHLALRIQSPEGSLQHRVHRRISRVQQSSAENRVKTTGRMPPDVALMVALVETAALPTVACPLQLSL